MFGYVVMATVGSGSVVVVIGDQIPTVDTQSFAMDCADLMPDEEVHT